MGQAIWLLVATAFTYLTVSCNNSKMSGSSANLSAAKSENAGSKVASPSTIILEGFASAIAKPEDPKGVKTLDIGTAFEVKDGSIALAIESGYGDKSQESKTMRPLAVYFVIDSTASMQGNIDAIKKGVSAFISKLKEKNFNAQVGYVDFKDSVGFPSELLDAAALEARISSLNAVGGDDPNEASLTAFRLSLSHTLERAPKDAIKAILTITDNPGHNDNKIGNPPSGTTRDCTIDSVIAAINGLPQDQQELVKIFHSVGSNDRNAVPCGGYSSAKAQWDAILDRVLPSVPKVNRGGPLNYPFDGNVLNNDFIALLEKTSPGADLVCLVKEIELFADDVLLASKEVTNLNETYGIYVKGQPLTWDAAIPESSQNAVLSATQNMAKVSSCCYEKSAAAAGNFSKCENPKTINVNFKVVPSPAAK